MNPVKGRASIQEAPPADVPAEPSAEPAPAEQPREESDGDAKRANSSKPPKPPSEPPVPRPLKQIRDEEATALKDYLQTFGPQGSVRVKIDRSEPKYARVNGKDVKIEGYIETLDEFLTEADIQERWGGGKYDLTITARADNGSYKYAGHRVVKVSGPPKVGLDDVKDQAAQPTTPTSDQPHLFKEMMGFMKGELDHARKPEGIPPAVQVLLEQLRDDRRRDQQALDDLRRELREAQNKKPPEDPIKDKLLGTLMDGESGRVTALRTQFESEIRSLKDNQQADIRRIEDRHDRAMADLRSSHEREIATIKTTYEREISALRSSHEVALASAKATSEIQSQTLKHEIGRLERDLDSIRKERDTLRDKKDRSPLELIKEVEAFKEALGAGGDDSSTVGKIVEVLPAVAETVGGIVAQARGQAPGQVPGVQAAVNPAAAQPARPRIVASQRTGQRFVQQGNQLVPVRPKPKIVTNDAGTPVEAPQVEESQLALLISQMEQAFRRDEEPSIVAQTGRTFTPAHILAWIRDNDTEASSGLELFLSKVAKLPSTSPLSSQGGRNWLRKVGKALIEGV